MTGQRWVVGPDDGVAHLLRCCAPESPGDATVRCGLGVRLGEGTVVHGVAPEGACGVCVGLELNDQVAQAVEDLLTGGHVPELVRAELQRIVGARRGS